MRWPPFLGPFSLNLLSVFWWIDHVIPKTFGCLKCCMLKSVVNMLCQLLGHHMWHPLLLIVCRLHIHLRRLLLRLRLLVLIPHALIHHRQRLVELRLRVHRLLRLIRDVGWLGQILFCQLHRPVHRIFQTERRLTQVWGSLLLQNIIEGHQGAVQIQAGFIER